MADSSTPSPVPRDAAIFVSGLGREWTDQSLEAMARRMAVAFDHASKKEAAFVAKLAPALKYADDPGAKASAATISRVDGSADQPVLDLYGFDYHRILTQGFAAGNLLVQAVVLVAMILYSTGRLVTSVVRPRRDEQGRRIGHATRAVDVFQLLLAVSVLLLFCAYASFVIWALVQTVVQLVSKGSHRGAGPSLPQAVVVLASAAGLSVPKVRAAISKAALEYLGATAYLGFGFQRAKICGYLVALVERVAEHRAPEYRRIFVIAYSFGSIVTLDTLYPKQRTAPSRAEEIPALVTIGCPFDMVRTYWRDYFHGRDRPPGDRRWWNVHSPVDVLSSNFRNDPKQEQPTVGIVTTESPPQTLMPDQNIVFNPSGSDTISFFGFLVMAGLRAHATYWEEDPQADSCLTDVVKRLYARPQQRPNASPASEPAGTGSAVAHGPA